MFGTVHLPKPNNQQLTIQMVWFREMNLISIQSVYILLRIDEGEKKKTNILAQSRKTLT